MATHDTGNAQNYAHLIHCNDLMTDAGGIDTPEAEMRKLVLRKAAVRRIEFLEPEQVKKETRLVEEINFVRA